MIAEVDCYYTEEDYQNMAELDCEIEKCDEKYTEFDNWLHAELNKEMVTLEHMLTNLNFEYKDPHKQEYTICIYDIKGYAVRYILDTLEVYGSVSFSCTKQYKLGDVITTGLIVTFDELYDNGWGDVLLNAFITKSPIDYVISVDHNYDIEEITPDNSHKIIRIEPCIY